MVIHLLDGDVLGLLRDGHRHVFLVDNGFLVVVVVFFGRRDVLLHLVVVHGRLLVAEQSADQQSLEEGVGGRGFGDEENEEKSFGNHCLIESELKTESLLTFN